MSDAELMKVEHTRRAVLGDSYTRGFHDARKVVRIKSSNYLTGSERFEDYAARHQRVGRAHFPAEHPPRNEFYLPQSNVLKMMRPDKRAHGSALSLGKTPEPFWIAIEGRELDQEAKDITLAEISAEFGWRLKHGELSRRKCSAIRGGAGSRVGERADPTHLRSPVNSSRVFCRRG